MSTTTLPAPAKINLLLAVTGRRVDGFHDLLSVAAPLAWGDTVSVETGAAGISVECDDPGVPTDGSNLVIKAARAFAEATGWGGGAHFTLKKRIPYGAGLGGASSDAASALMALNGASGSPLDSAGLARVASAVGSDCALFLSGGPVIMRGRGERVEPLPREAYRRIRGVRVLLFKPGFAISTPWAYAALAAGAPGSYLPESRAEARLASWISSPRTPVGDLLFNSMERPAFAKFAALPCLLERVRRFGYPAGMTGSGSACFALLNESSDAAPLVDSIRRAWGPASFVMEARIA